jgi:Sec23-binding domain of Sec16/WW domain
MDDEDDWLAQPVQSFRAASAAAGEEDEDVAFFNRLQPAAHAAAAQANGLVPPSPPPLFSAGPGGDGERFFDELVSPGDVLPPVGAGPTPRRAKAREDAAYFEQLHAEVGSHDPPPAFLAQTAVPPSPVALASLSPALVQSVPQPVPWKSSSASDECFFDELGGSPREHVAGEPPAVEQRSGWDATALPVAAGSGYAGVAAPEAFQPEQGAYCSAEPAALLNARISLSAGICPGLVPSALPGYAEEAFCEEPLAEQHSHAAATAEAWAHLTPALAGEEQAQTAAADAALPAGWVSGYSPEGYLYFFNLHSGESSWVHPAGAAAPPPLPTAQAEPAVWQEQAEVASWQQQPQQQQQQGGWEAPAQALERQDRWQASEPAVEPNQAAWAQAQYAAPEVVQPQPWLAPQLAAQPAGGYSSPYAAPVAASSVDPARLAHGRPPCPAVCFGFDGSLVTCHPGGTAYGGLGVQAGPVRVRPLAQLLRAAGGAGAAFLEEAEALASRPGFGSGGGLAGLAGIAARTPSLPDLARISEERGAAEAALAPTPASSLLLWGILRLMCTHKGNMGSDGAGPPLLQLLQEPVGGDAGQLPPSPLQAVSSQVQQSAASAAVEAERLLLCGQRTEALAAMVRGGLWGPALLLAPSCGERAHAETAAACLQSGLLPGTALHTCLSLAAGLPGLAGGVPGDAAARTLYLLSWRRNLGALLASRAAGDGAAMVAMGDALWSERRDVAAAHACYLLAGVAPSALGSPGARVCLLFFAPSCWRRRCEAQTPRLRCRHCTRTGWRMRLCWQSWDGSRRRSPGWRWFSEGCAPAARAAAQPRSSMRRWCPRSLLSWMSGCGRRRLGRLAARLALASRQPPKCCWGG